MNGLCQQCGAFDIRAGQRCNSAHSRRMVTLSSPLCVVELAQVQPCLARPNFHYQACSQRLGLQRNYHSQRSHIITCVSNIQPNTISSTSFLFAALPTLITRYATFVFAVSAQNNSTCSRSTYIRQNSSSPSLSTNVAVNITNCVLAVANLPNLYISLRKLY